MGAAQVVRLSVEEYLALDRGSDLPSEYHDGEVFPMENASLRHGLVHINVGALFLERLRGRDCRIVNQTRIRINLRRYVYPDLVVYCGKPQFVDSEQDMLTNPKVIIEILSPRTADYDYGSKFALYRELPSLEEYVLVAQSQPKVEIFRKGSDGRWVLSSYTGLDANAKIESLQIDVPLSQVYAGVEFDPAAEA